MFATKVGAGSRARLRRLPTASWSVRSHMGMTSEYDGIVLQAVIAHRSGFLHDARAVHETGPSRVTPKMRRMVMIATAGVMMMYLFQFAVRLFPTSRSHSFTTRDRSALRSASDSIALAAFNLVIDFDFIERAEARGAAKSVEWVAALGLVVTLVWLYLEVLRLLSKLRD